MGHYFLDTQYFIFILNEYYALFLYMNKPHILYVQEVSIHFIEYLQKWTKTLLAYSKLIIGKE